MTDLDRYARDSGLDDQAIDESNAHRSAGHTSVSRVPRWRVLVEYLHEHGPTTTGELGHVYGIGENVRGIRIEANAALRRCGADTRVASIRTYDTDGRRLPWRTYALVKVAPCGDHNVCDGCIHDDDCSFQIGAGRRVPNTSGCRTDAWDVVGVGSAPVKPDSPRNPALPRSPSSRSARSAAQGRLL